MDTKHILSDWQKYFPVLSQYTSSTLYVRVDVVLLGLRFDKVLSDTYRVVLECLPLWEQDKRKINVPVFSYELLDKKKRQLFVKYSLHDSLFASAITCAEQQFGAILKENILISDLFSLMRNVSSAFIPKHNPLDWVRLFELKQALAVYCNNIALSNEIKSEIEREICYWDDDRFQKIFLKSIMDWKTDLYQKMSNRELFIKQIALNVSDKKILRLNEAHFVVD